MIRRPFERHAYRAALLAISVLTITLAAVGTTLPVFILAAVIGGVAIGTLLYFEVPTDPVCEDCGDPVANPYVAMDSFGKMVSDPDMTLCRECASDRANKRALPRMLITRRDFESLPGVLAVREFEGEGRVELVAKRGWKRDVEDLVEGRHATHVQVDVVEQNRSAVVYVDPTGGRR